MEIAAQFSPYIFDVENLFTWKHRENLEQHSIDFNKNFHENDRTGV